MKVSKPKGVDSYIANSGREARPKLKEIRKIIKSTIPKVEEGISYGVPFYKYHGALAGFAAFKNHVSFGLVRPCFKVKTAKCLKKKLHNRKRNHTNQVPPKSADHSDKANSKSKSKKE